MQGDRDYGSYKDARRREARKEGGPPDEDMFFGASPAQKKALRETDDKRGLRLDDLDLNAVDRDRFDAPDKVGESLRLIDMAMGEEAKGRGPAVDPRPPGAGAPQPRRPTRRPEPKKQKKKKKPPKQQRRRRRRLLRRRGEDDGPRYEEADLTIVLTAGQRVERVAWALAALTLAAALALRAGLLERVSALQQALPAGLATRAGALQLALAAGGGGLAWLALVLRALRAPRRGALRETAPAAFVALPPAAALAAALAWGDGSLALGAAPPAALAAATEALASAPAPAPLVAGGVLALVAFGVAWAARLRRPWAD